ncbi:MAG: hypothetical protein ACK5V3_04005, partial [Bdellovibrionales bacterium]
MKKLGFFLLVIGAVGGLWIQNKSPINESLARIQKKLNPSSHEPVLKKIDSGISNEKFDIQLSRASQQLSQLQEDPVQVELELRQWAQSMSQQELSRLEDLSFDRQVHQDLRFLAVTLLSWSKNSAAADLLTNIAGSSFDEILNPGRMGDFEKILRLRAAEGLGELSISTEDKKNHLHSILNSTPYTEVADRIQRLRWSLD